MRQGASIIDRTLPAAIMSLNAARDLSIPELLYVLNEKLSLECAVLRDATTPPSTAAASLESEVSIVSSLPTPTSV